MNYLSLDETRLEKVVQLLNKLLANYHVHYQKLRNYHWNITGEHFFDLHEKFELLYESARIKIDEIAERILTLRMAPVSNFSEYLEMADIKEPNANLSDEEMVTGILEDHRILIKIMRQLINEAAEIGDEGTVDLISGYLKELEKESWMLDAWKTRKLAVVNN